MHTGSGSGHVAVLGDSAPVEGYGCVQHGLGRVLPGEDEVDGGVGRPALIVQVHLGYPRLVAVLDVELERPVGVLVVVADQVERFVDRGHLGRRDLTRVLAERNVPVAGVEVTVALGVADGGLVGHDRRVGRADDAQFAVRQTEVDRAVDARHDVLRLVPCESGVAPVRAVEGGVAYEVVVEGLLAELDLVAVVAVDGGGLEVGRAVGGRTGVRIDLPVVGPVLGRQRLGGGLFLLLGGRVASEEVLVGEGAENAARHEGDSNQALDDDTALTAHAC